MSEKSFNQLLKERIESDASLTEAGLARKAGLSLATIRRMLAEDRSPRLETVEKICEALGTTVVQFMLPNHSQEEQRVAYLMTKLSLEQRRQLLGYTEALAASPDQAQQESPQAEE